MQFRRYRYPDLIQDFLYAMLGHLVDIRSLSNPHHHFRHRRKQSKLT